MPKRTDHNQPEIVAALRKVGASVQHLSSVGRGCPDLLVGFRQTNYLLEIKNTNGYNKLTPDEIRWLESWSGQAIVVRSVEEALAAIGAYGEML